MGRKRIYADRSEQMRAYRQRRQGNVPEVQKNQPAAGRPPSRPTRLQAVIGQVEALHADYEAWQDNLPKSLANSPTGDRLADTVEQLQTALDLLTSIEPPRGYGRD